MTILTDEHEKIIKTILTQVHRNPDDYIYAADIKELLGSKSEKAKFHETLKLLIDTEVLTTDKSMRLIPGRNNDKYRDINSLEKLMK
jgi:hypothetical protein